MFYNRFIELCAKSNKAPSQVAEELGITRGTVTGWKNGSSPREKMFCKIADYFGVTVAYLKGEAPPGTEKAPASEAGSEGSANDRRILELLNKFSTLPKDQQALVVALVDSLLQGR